MFALQVNVQIRDFPTSQPNGTLKDPGTFLPAFKDHLTRSPRRHARSGVCRTSGQAKSRARVVTLSEAPRHTQTHQGDKHAMADKQPTSETSLRPEQQDPAGSDMEMENVAGEATASDHQSDQASDQASDQVGDEQDEEDGHQDSEEDMLELRAQTLCRMAEEWESNLGVLDNIIANTSNLFNIHGYEDSVEHVCRELLDKEPIPKIYAVQLNFFLAAYSQYAGDHKQLKEYYFGAEFEMADLEAALAATNETHKMTSNIRVKLEKMRPTIDELQRQEKLLPSTLGGPLSIEEAYARLERYKQAVRRSYEMQQLEREAEEVSDIDLKTQSGPGDENRSVQAEEADSESTGQPLDLPIRRRSPSEEAEAPL